MQDLHTKLQLKKIARLELVNAPAAQQAALQAALPALEVKPYAGGQVSALMVFLNNHKELLEMVPRVAVMLAQGGILWLVYPTTVAKGGTDINRASLWQLVEPLGWRPVRQVALDEVWSALRFKPA